MVRWSELLLGQPLTKTWGCGGLTVRDLLTIKLLVFLALSFIPHRLHHCWILQRSLHKLSEAATLSSGLRTEHIKVELSAYWTSLFSKLDPKSAVYIKKSSGPRTLPWGTPEITGFKLLAAPLTKTLCFLLCKKSLRIFKRLPPIPSSLSLYTRALWLTRSNAALKSIWTIGYEFQIPYQGSLVPEINIE